jgi:hypothetical protein
MRRPCRPLPWPQTYCACSTPAVTIQPDAAQCKMQDAAASASKNTWGPSACILTLCSSSRPHGLLLQCSIVQGSSHWQHGQ